jgi:hypothetical protein
MLNVLKKLRSSISCSGGLNAILGLSSVDDDAANGVGRQEENAFNWENCVDIDPRGVKYIFGDVEFGVVGVAVAVVVDKVVRFRSSVTLVTDEVGRFNRDTDESRGRYWLFDDRQSDDVITRPFQPGSQNLRECQCKMWRVILFYWEKQM